MYPQLLKNVRVEDKAAVTGNARVQVEKDRISTALGEDGRILLRESGTEPVIRVMVEAQSDELCAKYVDEMVQVSLGRGACSGVEWNSEMVRGAGAGAPACLVFCVLEIY